MTDTAEKRMIVLIVDDHEDSRAGLRTLLELEGYRIEEAGTAARAVDLALERHPDAIVVDLSLPDGDGCQVAERVRTAGNGYRPVLVAFTGWGRAEDRERAGRAGFEKFMLKPGDMTELLATLRALVK